MKGTVGLILVLVGGAAMLYAIGAGLWPVIALYRDTLADPLSEASPGDGKAISAEMWRAVIVGVVGFVPFLIGTVLLKVALFQRMRRAMRGKVAR
jgi:hypothetical protein